MNEKRPWMLTHSYNWIMAPLLMRSWEGHTAYRTSYVAVTSSMTPQPTIPSPSAVSTHTDGQH